MGHSFSSLSNGWHVVRRCSYHLCSCPTHHNSLSYSVTSATSPCRSCIFVVLGIIVLPVGCFWVFYRWLKYRRQYSSKDSQANKKTGFPELSSVPLTSQEQKQPDYMGNSSVQPNSQAYKETEREEVYKETERADPTSESVPPEIKKDDLPQDNLDYKNYLFFMNRLKSMPNGDFIDKIHEEWWEDYVLLERHHGYIQWLFPLPEPGVNCLAHVLHPVEVNKIKSQPKAKERLLKSYRMMLGFYGFELVDAQTGEVKRADNYKERFNNLRRNSHNNLRISRILRCLGLLGYEHLQYPLMQAFLREIVQEGTLVSCKQSCFNFWMNTLTDSDYERAQSFAKELENAKMSQITRDREAKVLTLNAKTPSQHAGFKGQSLATTAEPSPKSSLADYRPVEHSLENHQLLDVSMSEPKPIESVQDFGGNDFPVDMKRIEPKPIESVQDFDGNALPLDMQRSEPKPIESVQDFGGNGLPLDMKAIDIERNEARHSNKNEQPVDMEVTEPDFPEDSNMETDHL